MQNAEYSAGRNPIEAKVVVDCIAECLHKHPEQSIGVITFNIQQRLTILDAIDERCLQDQSFQENFARANQESIDKQPFVKSLENVQGDERDIILFSVGHSPVQRKGLTGTEWRVPARFGPLARKGGERRLNVAISRAKQKCIVIASFTPEQLSVGNTKHNGPKLLKLFLEYAYASSNEQKINASLRLNEAAMIDYKHSETQITQIHSIPEATPLDVQITLAVEKFGFHIEQNFGISTFKIPLALFKENCSPIAILINDGNNGQNAFDLFVHRPTLLEQKGWKTLTINPMDWLRNRQSIVRKIVELSK